MSNYSPEWIDSIDPKIWKIITTKIYLYPQRYIELVDSEEEIMNCHAPKENNISAGFISDPTARIAIRLADKHRQELNRQCESVNFVLSALSPDYYRVVCLKFWGVENTNDAFSAVRAGISLCGYKYQDMRRIAGYTESGAKKIIHRFVVKVGKNLGEL